MFEYHENLIDAQNREISVRNRILAQIAKQVAEQESTDQADPNDPTIWDPDI